MSDARPQADNKSKNAHTIEEALRSYKQHLLVELETLADRVAESQGRGEIGFKLVLAFNAKDGDYDFVTKGSHKHPDTVYVSQKAEIGANGQIRLL